MEKFYRRWASTQRILFHKGLLPEWRIKELEKRNFPWKINGIDLLINHSVFSELHSTKNEGIDLENISLGSGIKLWWVCKECNYDWKTDVAHRTSKINPTGCPKCGGTMRSNTREFIDKATKIHGDRFDYSKVQYVAQDEPVIIICKLHGEFSQKPNGHLSGGYGCPMCAGKLTTEVFVEKLEELYGDKYKFVNVNYETEHSEVKGICSIHGNFVKEAKSLLDGFACSNCGWERVKQFNTKSFESFLEEAKKIHRDKYDYSKVDNFVDRKTKIPIRCNVHGIFFQTPQSHLTGTGCPKCGEGKAADSTRLSLEEFISKAKSIHGNKYNYDKCRDYKSQTSMMTITCPLHGDFEQRAGGHMNGKGCSECGRQSIGDNHRMDVEEFIKRSKELHNDKYDYSKIDYRNALTKIKIGCPIHGIFQQTPSGHLVGKGCKKCADIQNGLNKRRTTEHFIIEAKKIHGDYYDYSQTVYQGRVKLKIICPIHGVMEQWPDNHLRGFGCRKCRKKR